MCGTANLTAQCLLWVMCGRRLGKSIFDAAAALVGCGHVSGLFMRPGMAAGDNALRGSGPNRKHAFKDALTQASSPDPPSSDHGIAVSARASARDNMAAALPIKVIHSAASWVALRQRSTLYQRGPYCASQQIGSTNGSDGSGPTESSQSRHVCFPPVSVAHSDQPEIGARNESPSMSALGSTSTKPSCARNDETCQFRPKCIAALCEVPEANSTRVVDLGTASGKVDWLSQAAPRHRPPTPYALFPGRRRR